MLRFFYHIKEKRKKPRKSKELTQQRMLGHLKVNYVNMIVLRKFTPEIEYMGVHNLQLIFISNKRIR